MVSLSSFAFGQFPPSFGNKGPKINGQISGKKYSECTIPVQFGKTTLQIPMHITPDEADPFPVIGLRDLGYLGMMGGEIEFDFENNYLVIGDDVRTIEEAAEGDLELVETWHCERIQREKIEEFKKEDEKAAEKAMKEKEKMKETLESVQLMQTIAENR